MDPTHVHLCWWHSIVSHIVRYRISDWRRRFLFRLYEAIWRLLATRVESHTIVYASDHEEFAELKYVMHFERKPAYYAINVIVPCCLLVVISLLVRSHITSTPGSARRRAYLPLLLLLYIVSYMYIGRSDVTECMVRYDRHFVGITWHNMWSQGTKIYRVISMLFNPLVYKKCLHDQ